VIYVKSVASGVVGAVLANVLAIVVQLGPFIAEMVRFVRSDAVFGGASGGGILLMPEPTALAGFVVGFLWQWRLSRRVK
jgi:hypothetical protein